jgi:hypothetical protein
MNNNAELDNGVYHQEDEEASGAACNDLTSQSLTGGGLPSVNKGNLATSFGQE